MDNVFTVCHYQIILNKAQLIKDNKIIKLLLDYLKISDSDDALTGMFSFFKVHISWIMIRKLP